MFCGSDYSSGGARYIDNVLLFVPFLQKKHFARRFLIKYYINNCGWSHKFISRSEENENRREPIKSSFRLPVLRNKYEFLILACSGVRRKTPRKTI